MFKRFITVKRGKVRISARPLKRAERSYSVLANGDGSVTSRNGIRWTVAATIV